MSVKLPKQTIIIVGSGFGGITFYNNINKDLYDVTIISPTSYFLYTPLMYKAIFDNINITSPIETIKDYVVDIETDKLTKKNIITTKEGNIYTADYIVFSHGSTVNTYDIDGVEKYCKFLKTKSHIEELQRWIKDNYNSDKKINLAIIGCGNTGIELVGACIDTKKFNITVIDALQYPLNNETIGTYIKKFWTENNVNMFFGHTVKRIDSKKIYIEKGKNIELDYDLAIWCGGIESNELTNFINKKFRLDSKNGLGSGLLVDNKLKIIGMNNMYAIGDCAQSQFPKTAQIAHQQGKYLANQFNYSFFSKMSFRPDNMGNFTYIGNDQSIYNNKNYFIGGKIVYYANTLLHWYYTRKFRVHDF